MKHVNDGPVVCDVFKVEPRGLYQTRCKACGSKAKKFVTLQAASQPKKHFDTESEAWDYIDSHKSTDSHAKAMREAYLGGAPEEIEAAEYWLKMGWGHLGNARKCEHCGGWHQEWTRCAPLPDRYREVE